MSFREVLSKASLRAIIAVTLIFVFTILIVYLIRVARKDLSVEGRIDVAQLITAFLTLIGLITGWLFGRREGARQA